MRDSARIAAFFDIDGTLVPRPSLERRFLSYLRWRALVGWKHFVRCAAPLAREALRTVFAPGAHLECMTSSCKTYLAGVPISAMDAWFTWLARHPIELFPGARERITWHTQQGHKIFLLSGTLAPLARAVARQIPVPAEVIATELEIERGHFTGKIHGEAVCGPAKLRAIEALAEEHSLDLSGSYAYGDSFADRWILARMGNACVVQTSSLSSWRLARLARERGWLVLRWRTTQERTESRRLLAAQVKCQ